MKCENKATAVTNAKATFRFAKEDRIWAEAIVTRIVNNISSYFHRIGVFNDEELTEQEQLEAQCSNILQEIYYEMENKGDRLIEGYFPNKLVLRYRETFVSYCKKYFIKLLEEKIKLTEYIDEEQLESLKLLLRFALLDKGRRSDQ